jgi:protein-S-isoprenylcysteine O-methyltransferase Ste14
MKDKPVSDDVKPDSSGPPPRKINPPHYFALSLIAMGLLRWLVDSQPLLGPLAWIGVLPIVAGGFVAFRAAGQFAKAGTNIVPLTRSTALVTSGMFARSRNPMYASMSVVLIGIALLLDRAAPWIVVPIFVAILRLRFIRYEERLMQATFGQAYLDYKARVRRWL